MYHKEISEKQSSAWLAAALAAPLAQTASACSWPVVLAVGCICLFTCWGVAKYAVEPGRWLRAVQSGWACVVISELLHWSTYCWPTHQSYRAVPLTLLALAVWTVSGGREKAARAGCVLVWPLALLFGAVFLSGLPEVEMQNLTPAWQMPDAHLITVLLIPALCQNGRSQRNGRLLIGLLLFAIAASVVTAGVLSAAVSGQMRAPVYELSRSLSLLGITKRFESLVAVALTLGYFSTLTCLLRGPGSVCRGKKPVWICAGVSAVLFFSNLRVDSRLLAGGSILLWVVLPVICHWKNNFQKMKKQLDKRRRRW